MKLTREWALELHRRMWTDMQKELGDKPQGGERILFKEKWCEEHFPKSKIACNCFLCEYVFNNSDYTCKECPVVWPDKDCHSELYYYSVPISEILALPEREVE